MVNTLERFMPPWMPRVMALLPCTMSTLVAGMWIDPAVRPKHGHASVDHVTPAQTHETSNRNAVKRARLELSPSWLSHPRLLLPIIFAHVQQLFVVEFLVAIYFLNQRDRQQCRGDRDSTCDNDRPVGDNQGLDSVGCHGYTCRYLVKDAHYDICCLPPSDQRVRASIYMIHKRFIRILFGQTAVPNFHHHLIRPEKIHDWNKPTTHGPTRRVL